MLFQLSLESFLRGKMLNLKPHPGYLDKGGTKFFKRSKEGRWCFSILRGGIYFVRCREEISANYLVVTNFKYRNVHLSSLIFILKLCVLYPWN